MKNKTAFVKLWLIMLLAVGSTRIFAQTYPITGINILLPAAPDPNTNNWGTGSSRFNIMAAASTAGGGIDPAVMQSRMLVIITKDGYKVCGAYNANSAPSANFNRPNKAWDGSYAASFLGKGCILPPGDYELSVQFFGYQNGKLIALSDQISRTFSISDNNKPGDQQPGRFNPRVVTENKPVYPNKPGNQQPGNVNPRVVTENKPAYPNKPDNQQPGNVNPRVVTENKPAYPNKPNNQQPGDVNPRVVTENKPTYPNKPDNHQPGNVNPRVVTENKPTYPNKPDNQQPGIVNPGADVGGKPTTPDKPVNPKPDAANPVVDNGSKPTPKKPGLLGRLGKIAIGGIAQGGTISINLSSPPACECGSWEPITINRTTKFQCGGKNIIPWKCGELLSFLSTYDCTSKDRSCQALTTWEIKKDGVSIIGGQGDHNITGEFTPQANGIYTLTLTAACNGKKCGPCVYTIGVEGCNTCDCGAWGPLLVNHDVKYDCGYKNTIPWKCNQPFNFASMYRCGSNNQDCEATTNWEIARDGVRIKTGEGANNVADAFTPTANGTYTITLNAECNGIKCPPCIYTIAVEDCKTCDCGAWGPLAVNNRVKFEPGAQNNIQWKCNQPFSFTSAYRCGMNNQGCQAVTSWEIDKDGTSIKTGSGTIDVADTFTPTGNGTYSITLNAVCNGLQCPPAVYTIVVADCTTCGCGQWLSPVVNIRGNGGVVSGLKCGETASLARGSYSFSIPDFVCSPGDGSCAVSYSWSVQGGPVVVNGTRQTFTYNFGQAGIYNINITPICGGKKCQPCHITVSVTDDIPVPGPKPVITEVPVNVPDPKPYISVNTVNNKKSNDTTSSVAGTYYYDLDKAPTYDYTEIFDNTLSVQFVNNYASVENIKLNIYDVASHKMFTPKNQKEVRLISVTGLNRLSVDLNKYQLEPGRLYLFTVSVFSSNYHINFKVIRDHEK